MSHPLKFTSLATSTLSTTSDAISVNSIVFLFAVTALSVRYSMAERYRGESMLTRVSPASVAGKTEVKTKNSRHNLVLLHGANTKQFRHSANKWRRNSRGHESRAVLCALHKLCRTRVSAILVGSKNYIIHPFDRDGITGQGVSFAPRTKKYFCSLYSALDSAQKISICS